MGRINQEGPLLRIFCSAFATSRRTTTLEPACLLFLLLFACGVGEGGGVRSVFGEGRVVDSW